MYRSGVSVGVEFVQQVIVRINTKNEKDLDKFVGDGKKGRIRDIQEEN